MKHLITAIIFLLVTILFHEWAFRVIDCQSQSSWIYLGFILTILRLILALAYAGIPGQAPLNWMQLAFGRNYELCPLLVWELQGFSYLSKQYLEVCEPSQPEKYLAISLIGLNAIFLSKILAVASVLALRVAAVCCGLRTEPRGLSCLQSMSDTFAIAANRLEKFVRGVEELEDQFPNPRRNQLLPDLAQNQLFVPADVRPPVHLFEVEREPEQIRLREIPGESDTSDALPGTQDQTDADRSGANLV